MGLRRRTGRLDSGAIAEHKASAVDAMIAETVADPNWFAHRYDFQRDEFHFVRIPAEQHAAIPFLSEVQAPPELRRMIPRPALRGLEPQQAPLHLIMHSGLGGSTLLARALSQTGASLALKEPPILTDVVAHRISGASREDNASLLREVAGLLARPLAPAMVIKLSSVGNGLASDIADIRPDTRVLCLQTPLAEMLASLAGRGAEGRAGGRRLFVGLRNSRMIPFAIGETEAARLSDLQSAALAWLAIQQMFDDAAKALGPARVRGIESARLLSDFENALSAIAGHFQIGLDVERRLSTGIATIHAKSGEPFSPESRAERLQAILREHQREIDAVVDWIRPIAEAGGIPLEIPYPLPD